MEVAEECIPDQNGPPIPILASAKAVDPTMTDNFGLEIRGSIAFRRADHKHYLPQAYALRSGPQNNSFSQHGQLPCGHSAQSRLILTSSPQRPSHSTCVASNQANQIERKMEPVSSADKNSSVEQRPTSFLPTFDDSSSEQSSNDEPVNNYHDVVEPAPSSPLHTRRQHQQHHYAVANSITGCFSDISRRYSIDYSRVLGAGTGMTVCVGQDLETGELYAVKTIAKGHHEQRNLHREVSLLRDLRDEAREFCPRRRAGRCGGVIELVDLHEDASNLHFVTELCRGGELTDRIYDKVEESERLRAEHWSSPPCFSDDDASKVLRQVLSALEFLHSRNICHRDVKPENILFLHREGTKGPDGKDVGLTVRLTDLGLARYHHVSSFEPRMSTVVGTCTFIAPEVLRRRYDRRCDHWSLGVVAYVMMCGYPPFVGNTNEEVCEAVLKGRFRFDPKQWDDVSKDAEGFVRGLLKVNVKSRMGGEEAMEHPFIVDGGTNEGGEDESGSRGIHRSSSSVSIGREGGGILLRSISKLSLRRNISKLSLTSMTSAEGKLEE
ncbi:hypothetical protein THAOC_18498 [Thalassiosira oceanica]|uniref:Protein kinase domain-containing protein n=1 Tax=Thalassiosira oceanica TaxID=159749 RepID=K0SJ92_THAOC|nr:hypothetical protein THAOC_18498 [Thalassiosira oceanica]|eukprot:EJK61066.1 hypothetical protein THAOC_18498 [Thalassiosira oceanica]